MSLIFPPSSYRVVIYFSFGFSTFGGPLDMHIISAFFSSAWAADSSLNLMWLWQKHLMWSLPSYIFRWTMQYCDLLAQRSMVGLQNLSAVCNHTCCTSASLSPVPGTCRPILCFYEFDCFELHVSITLQYLSFSLELISLSVVSSRCINVFTYGKIALF